MQAGRDPRNRVLSDLIGELSTRSEEFATRWARESRTRMSLNGGWLLRLPEHCFTLRLWTRWTFGQ